MDPASGSSARPNLTNGGGACTDVVQRASSMVSVGPIDVLAGFLFYFNLLTELGIIQINIDVKMEADGLPASINDF